MPLYSSAFRIQLSFSFFTSPWFLATVLARVLLPSLNVVVFCWLHRPLSLPGPLFVDCYHPAVICRPALFLPNLYCSTVHACAGLANTHSWEPNCKQLQFVGLLLMLLLSPRCFFCCCHLYTVIVHQLPANKTIFSFNFYIS
jgi:hypothetical protein